MIPFGVQLIGQTEKALNALLLTILIDHQLSERQWVALRLTEQFDGSGSLSEFVQDRTQFLDAATILSDLTLGSLVAGGALTPKGRELTARIGTDITSRTEPIWHGLDADDRASTERVLNVVLERSRALLASLRRDVT